MKQNHIEPIHELGRLVLNYHWINFEIFTWTEFQFYPSWYKVTSKSRTSIFWPSLPMKCVKDHLTIKSSKWSIHNLQQEMTHTNNRTMNSKIGNQKHIAGPLLIKYTINLKPCVVNCGPNMIQIKVKCILQLNSSSPLI